MTCHTDSGRPRHADRPSLKGGRGFSLIEALFAVMILGILAALVLPSYSDYLLRGKLTAGVALLKSTRERLELYYADNRSYALATGACATGSFSDRDSSFAYACTVSDAGQGFVLTATGSSATAGFGYSLDHAGIERTTAVRAGWSAATLPVTRFIVAREP